MKEKNFETLNLQTSQKAGSRDGFGKALLKLGKNKKVIVLTADLGESTRADWFKKEHPDRFVECGVAEQNLVGVAAGLALNGKIPFACSFGVFVPGRCWDQIRISVCYNNANVKLVGSHTGIVTGADGATHQALEDIASLRAIPNITIINPCDAVEAEKATIAIAQHKGPVYLRLFREELPVFTTDKTPFKIGKAELFKDGTDVAIIACGPMVYEALIAAQQLEQEGINAMVINSHTIKPLDTRTVVQAAQKTGAIVTAEDHQTAGGLGSAVAETIAQTNPVPIRFVGIKDSFGESGSAKELMKKYCITAKDIASAAREVIAQKRGICTEAHEEELALQKPIKPLPEKTIPEFLTKIGLPPLGKGLKKKPA